MPGERRNLRSNKESSSTDGEKARSNSTSSGSSKDKPVPTRSTSSKNKTLPAKKPTTKESTADKPLANGTEPVENGVNGSQDVEMVDEAKNKGDVSKKGEDEMTVVVPPSKGAKIAGGQGDEQGDDTKMEGIEATGGATSEAEVDPKVKAANGEHYYRNHLSIIRGCEPSFLYADSLLQTSKAILPYWNVL